MILALETSCDETAAAVVARPPRVRASVVGTQSAVHARYGGVVPEIAGREHVAALVPVTRAALEQAGVRESELTAVAVTVGPGLIGSLLVGVNYAQATAYRLGLPLVGVHHLEAHLLAVFLERDVTFPFLGLLVSGGHTHLYGVDRPGSYRLLGRTLDDAAGEAFDKGAIALGLPYPGGPSIQAAAKLGDATRYALPRALRKEGNFDFSFSGLKTAVRAQAQALGALTEGQTADLAASLQEAIVDSVVTKALAAAGEFGFDRVVVAGGVAANQRLRDAFVARAGRREVIFPSFALCTDNAAMVGCAAAFRLAAGQSTDAFAVRAKPHWPLESVAW
jgi:N6-L-threonylcarbamoyladenine synthase